MFPDENSLSKINIFNFKLTNTLKLFNDVKVVVFRKILLENLNIVHFLHAFILTTFSFLPFEKMIGNLLIPTASTCKKVKKLRGTFFFLKQGRPSFLVFEVHIYLTVDIGLGPREQIASSGAFLLL